MEIKKILVPTDLSPSSIKALDVAVYIARKTSAEVVLFNVVEMALPTNLHQQAPVDVASVVAAIDQTSQLVALGEMKKKLIAIQKDVKNKGVRVRSEVDLDVDNVFKDISDVIALRDDCDLIVMGTKGVSGIEEFFIGSNTERVVRNAALPVIAVKFCEEDFQIRRILYATDFEEIKNDVFKFLAYFSDIFDAKIDLVFVNTPNFFISNQDIATKFEKLIADNNLINAEYHIYNDFSEEKGILNFAKEIDADMVVMPTNGRTGLSHIFNGSIAEDVVNHALLPILTINMNKFTLK